jgi:hypothetical protein
MRNALALILSLGLLPGAIAQEAASADDLPSAASILDRYVEVTGGASAYEDMASQVATGTMEIAAAGLTGQLQIFTKPGLQFTSIELPGVGVIESGVKDGLAWENSALTGPRILEGSEAEFTILNARPDAALNWREVYSAVETTGMEDVNGEAAYRVEQTLGGGTPITSLYSVDSGLLLKNALTLNTPLGDIPIEQFVEDYQDFGGVLTPSRLVMMQLGQRIVITVTSAEANVEIPDERFDLPEAVQAILP